MGRPGAGEGGGGIRRGTLDLWRAGGLEPPAGKSPGDGRSGAGRGGGDRGHRSASLVWSVYGALAAGGCVVLLDPAYPADRLVRILERARPRAILRLEAAGALPETVDGAITALDPLVDLAIPPWSAWSEGGMASGPLADEPTTAPGVEVGPDDLAMLGFTSGSTGEPKGILGLHGPLTHFLPWQCERLGLDENDRYSLLSGLAHDPLQRDLFTPLATGATLCIPEADRLLESGYLAGWLASSRVSVAHLTPAMSQVVCSGGEPGGVPSLRQVILTGEALTVRDVSRLRRLAPGVRCLNFYGSTETQRAVGFSEAPLDLGTAQGEILPLGRGMEDVQRLVVGRSGEVAGLGELGEIWVRSPHLARGYLGAPGETAERFRANPLGVGASWDRVYATGDLGRYALDGQVRFAGRVDHQVKIRGFRIELGEIEGRLARQPEVGNVSVQLVGEGLEGKRLVAFVVASAGSEPGDALLDGLRRGLRGVLPDYMVPTEWIWLDALPMTPNGKLDRRALLRVAIDHGASQTRSLTVTGARTVDRSETHVLGVGDELEGRVIEVLKKVLGVSVVGPEDNFFDLGGNSLLLVQAHERLERKLGRAVSPLDLFQFPTPRRLAEHLGSTGRPGPLEERRSQQLQGRERMRVRRRQRRGEGESPEGR